MIHERVSVSERPTEVLTVPWRHSGVVLVNSGDVDVFVDINTEYVAADGPDAGLKIGPGVTVTLPRPEADFGMTLWAITPAGSSGELTYVLPGLK
jgi:hypothetical protein